MKHQQNSVQLREAKAKFSELLRRVENGEQIAITKRGKHVATLVPPAKSEGDYRGLLERAQQRREKIQREGRGLRVEDILSARDEGRK